MLFEPLFERFACGTPLSVMTRALLENALQPDPLDEPFERLAVTQHTRELLFSTVVETMAPVALPPEEWLQFRGLSAVDMAECLRHWAGGVCLAKIRKAGSNPRKKAKAKPAHDPSKPHLSTARLLAARRQRQ